MPYRIRRVVTGHDKAGKSVFVMDGKAPNVLEMASMPGVALTDLWRTKTAPASNAGNADAAAGRIMLEPPADGTILRIVEFPPDIGVAQERRRREGASPRSAPAARRTMRSADAMMHCTATVDYIIVLKGEIWAILDKGEKLLKQGDVLIQRGTNHSWSVRTKEPCVIAAVLVGAKPVGRLARKKAAPKRKR